MSLGRTAIMTALFKRLQAVPGLVTTSRRYRPVKDVSAKEQPALFLLASDVQRPSYQTEGVPATWEMDPAILLYVSVADKSLAPGEVLDPLIDTIESALLWVPGDCAPALGSPTTLGQLVTHCRIAGIQIGEGGESGQAVVQFDLNILVAGR